MTLCFDLLTLTVSYLGAYLFRFAFGIIPVAGEIPDFHRYAAALIVVIPVYLWLFRAYGLYQKSRHLRRIEEIFIVIKAISFAVVILMAITFFYRAFMYSRTYLVIVWFFSIILVSLSRYLLIQWEYRRQLDRKQIMKVLIIGANRNARVIIKWAKNNPHYGQEIIGVLGKNSELKDLHLEGAPILGTSGQYESFIRELKPDRVILVDTGFSRLETADLVEICEDLWIDFKIVADFFGMLTRHVDVEHVSAVPLLGFRSLPLDDIWNRAAKRIFDIAVTSAGLVLFSPVLILISLFVKLDDGGPVFYLQERVGRDEKVFQLIKFRTMKVDAEKETGPVWTRPDDGRRTRFGNFLRRSNLDELPQLLNVLRGDMSLAGPRPERPHFVSQFREALPRYISRHKIKSGITGWAQVNGYRGNTSIQERLKYDLYYMENWSLILDIEILFMTFFAAKAYRNAY